jgi:hypothetical protein
MPYCHYVYTCGIITLMGKLSILRKAIKRHPEKWMHVRDIERYEYDSDTGVWRLHNFGVDRYARAAHFDNRKVLSPTKGCSYLSFVRHVLRELGYVIE